MHMAIEGGFSEARHNGDSVREAAVGFALSHPSAEISSGLKHQIIASESYFLADARLHDPDTSYAEHEALEKIREGAELQIQGHHTLSGRQRAARAVGIGIVTAAIVVPTAKAAYETAAEIPHLAAERAAAEVPIEIGTRQIEVFGVDVTLPSFEETIEIREARIAEAQARLDDAVDTTVDLSLIAGGTFAAGAAAAKVFGTNGYDPVAHARRFLGRRKESEGWAELGETRETLKQDFMLRAAQDSAAETLEAARELAYRQALSFRVLDSVIESSVGEDQQHGVDVLAGAVDLAMTNGVPLSDIDQRLAAVQTENLGRTDLEAALPLITERLDDGATAEARSNLEALQRFVRAQLDRGQENPTP